MDLWNCGMAERAGAAAAAAEEGEGGDERVELRDLWMVVQTLAWQ